MQRRIPLTLFLFATLSGGALAADPITMEIMPALEGYSPSYGTVPVAVVLQNTGPNARGTLRVTAQDYQMDFPVELPTGSKKRILTFPSMYYGGATYLLLTDQGRKLENFNLSGSAPDGTQSLLLIGDSPGEMAFMKGAKTGSVPSQYGSNTQSSSQDAYTTPENAPTRPVGFANLAAVVLGSGAERLTDDTVQALKLYAMTGGTLAFVGGASAPVLRDARWQDVLPLKDFHTATVTNSNALASMGGYEVPTFSMTTGSPVPGASFRKEGPNVLTAERSYGLGKIVLTAFNPFEAPLSKWEGRRAAFTKVLRVTDQVRTNSFLSPYQEGYESYPSSVSIYSSSSYGGATTMGGGSSTQQEDPFSTSLPPTEKVFTLLGAYFIVVVPLNFLVLKRLKRGELAWFTAPLISLGFASAFFASAQGLYSAKMSTATQGVLIGQEGANEGMFIGKSQLFVPQGGSYDLKVAGIDSLGVVPSRQYYYTTGDKDTSELNPVDVGEVKMPHMQANNLAFREVDYRQRIPIGHWFSIRVKKQGPYQGTCVVRNDSSYTLDNAELYVGETINAIGPLEAGDEREIEYRIDPKPADVGQLPVLGQITSRNGSIALTGQLRGFRPGPQLGQQVDKRTALSLAYFAKEGLGAR